MNQRELKRIYRELQEKMEELESAIFSNTESYGSLDIEYQDVLDYYNDQPNAEEGL
mgnify:CR=1 FL=1